MLQESQGKNVVISLGTTDFSYVVKGEILDVTDSWLKVKTTKTTEYVNVEKIVKISIAN